HYPSRAECMVCHSRAANFVLGLSTEQMNRVRDYGGVKDEQLRTLEHLGVFRVGAADHLAEGRGRAPFAADPLSRLEEAYGKEDRKTTALPRRPDAYRRLVDPLDKTQPAEARARSYLHANCSICHVLAGGGNAQIDLEFTTPLDKTGLVGVKALHRLP